MKELVTSALKVRLLAIMGFVIIWLEKLLERIMKTEEKTRRNRISIIVKNIRNKNHP